ncbi:hypothetical protein QYM36_008231, partial [Artemia franciscana]
MLHLYSLLGGFDATTLSPVSSLANEFHGASLMDTPRKRLSLSSNCSSTIDTPETFKNDSDDTAPAKHLTPVTFVDKENSSFCASFTFSPAKTASLLCSPTRRQNQTSPVRRSLQYRLGSPSRRGLSIQSPSKSNIMLNNSPVRLSSPIRNPFSPPKSPSSQDSGYSGGESDGMEFKLPKKSPKAVKDGKSHLRLLSRTFSSISCEEDDGFLASAILESDDETVADPSDKFSSLLSAPITVQPPAAPQNSELIPRATTLLERSTTFVPKTQRPSRQSIRRCLSMVDTFPSNVVVSPLSSRNLETIEESPRQTPVCFKRPDPPRSHPSPHQNKRRKSDLQENENPSTDESIACVIPTSKTVVKKLFRSQSETDMSHHTIMRAVQSFSDNSDLIGDCTRPYALPLTVGKHPELKSISCHTLADLIRGKFNDAVSKFEVVDCRFPFEFNGGHIIHATNLWTKDSIYQEYLDGRGVARIPPYPTPELNAEKRNILIFHCEFSSERGPNLSRFLRNKDRDANKEHYPALHWPEIYLLEGGYKEFFTNYIELCEPKEYMPMLTVGYENELKICRAKAKTFSNDNGRQGRAQ